MAFLECSFHSETLGMARTMNVILPQKTYSQIGMEGKESAGKNGFPVLYLLHGLSDDHSIWMRRTSIERYAAAYGIAVVMPCVDRSYYTNVRSGMRYWDFIADELPCIVRQFFPVSNRREDTFVAGLSMGGFGAFKLALNRPERFAAAASFSGALDPADVFQRNSKEMEWAFESEEKIRRTENDLFFQAEKHSGENMNLPALYMGCGTEDFLYATNIRFRDHLRNLKIPVTYQERPGVHCWEFWDLEIQTALKWFPIQK